MGYDEKWRMNQKDIDWDLAEQEAIFNEACDNILIKANAAGWQLEVIWAAFKHKEQFPNTSLLECLQVGLDEWDL